ncbi:MAG: alpha/beta hydrolase [Sphingomonadaceae bacterium]|uniref:alpha/beta hydrolase n=1 Tax=Thermaurantiacus sp. TaxID=2820283 RepID=UPI00298F0CAA|nr:alpha/beta hydrolase [Thermaurantiacus sp.]MCS6985869.1 alpha/beta hydrolase [Sphingomonadaceae bacterium]MDW8413862.1 alpha/beta hydrolase [Thermaurantiacus sp.]
MSFERIPLHLVFEERAQVRDTYGGVEGLVALQAHWLKPATPSDTILVFMHPMGIMHYLPLPMALAAAGVPCLTAVSRYPNNDTALVMEKVVADLGAWVRHAREVLGYARVVLAGWSGGGSLALLYQRQAVAPFLVDTPAGDPVDLPPLVAADAMLQLAAHVSRAATLTEWLDPSVIDETDPLARDPAWNLYADPPPARPPYPADWLAEFRARQVARNRRITAWARQRLIHLQERLGPQAEQTFVVHGTMADPRWLDPSLDPNDREPGRCYLGDPRWVNDAPGGLARVSTLRSWLSQWGLDTSRADGPACGAYCTVPTLIVDNSADDACTPSHAERILAGIAAADRTRVTIRGANHYYAFQKERLAEAVTVIRGWLLERGFLRAA